MWFLLSYGGSDARLHHNSLVEYPSSGELTE